MKKAAFTLAAIVVIATLAYFLLSSENSTPKDTEAVLLRIGVENEFSSIDPLESTENSIARLSAQTLEGLVHLGPDGSIQPQLAESWESIQGGQVWRFRLREGVRFHSNPIFGASETKELSSADVVFSFERILSADSVFSFAFADIIEGASAFRADDAESLEGVKMIGPREVEFTLTRPDPNFPQRCTSPWVSIVPLEQSQIDASWGQQAMVGTGPFKFDSLESTHLKLSRFDDYWGDISGNLDSVEFITIKDDPLRLEAVRAGRIDAIFATPRQLQTLLVSGSKNFQLRSQFTNLNLESFSTFNSHFIGFNVTKLDRETRQLLSASIDRESLVANVLPGSAIVNPLPLPLDMLSTSPEAPRKFVNSEAPAENKKIEVIVHNQVSAPEYVEAAISAWRDLGFEVDFKTMSISALIDRIVKGDYEVAALWYEYPFSSPETILHEFYSADRQPMPNFFRYDSPAFNDFLKSIDSDDYTEEGLLNPTAVTQLSQIIHTDPPAAFLFERRISIIHRHEVSGIKVDRHSIPDLSGVVVEKN